NQPEIQSLGQESTEGLSGAADKFIFGGHISLRSRPAQHLSAQMRADGTIRVGDAETTSSCSSVRVINRATEGEIQLAIETARVFLNRSREAGRDNRVQQPAERA